MKHILFYVIAVAGTAIANNTAPATQDTFGSATVSRVCQVAPDGALICDLEGFPALIGKQIPVYLNDVEVAPDNEISQKVIAFIQQTVKPDANGQAPAIQLSDIRRGRTFSLIAKIAVNGKDLTEMLIEKGLAQRVIILDPASESTNAATGTLTSGTAKPQAAPAGGFVASKTSKVYHRPDCRFAKQMEPSKSLTFRTRQEAEQNGRRPCKTCNP